MQEVSKAWEHYYLDTGDTLPRNSTDVGSYNYYLLQSAGLLNDNGVQGWNGPYISSDIYTVFLQNSREEYIYIATLDPNSNWGGSIAWTDGFCSSGSACSTYIFVSKVDWGENIYKLIDERVDGSDGADAGRFRWWTDDNPFYKYRVFLEIAPVKNPRG